MSDTLIEILTELNAKEIYFRIENDEEGYYLSIINRKTYPRVWADNFLDCAEILAETPENLINRTVAVDSKDWNERFYSDNIELLLIQVKEWLSKMTAQEI